MKTRKEQMTTKGSFDGYHNFIGDDSEYQDWYGVAGRSMKNDSTIDFKALREYLGLTQEEAAAEVGCSRSSWQDWESGRRSPGKMARAGLEKLEKRAKRAREATK